MRFFFKQSCCRSADPAMTVSRTSVTSPDGCGAGMLKTADVQRHSYLVRPSAVRTGFLMSW
jgi:hypothetical protein